MKLTLFSPYEQVVKLVPNDRDARKKLEECEKTVKRIQFEAAIAAEHKDVFASLKIDDISKFLVLSKNILFSLDDELHLFEAASVEMFVSLKITMFSSSPPHLAPHSSPSVFSFH
jgi:hypothetical protein